MTAEEMIMEKEKVDQHNTKKRLSMLTASTPPSIPTAMVTSGLSGERATTSRVLHPSELTNPNSNSTSISTIVGGVLSLPTTTNNNNNNHITMAGMNKISLPTSIPVSTTTSTSMPPLSSSLLPPTLSTMSIAPPPPPMPASIPIKESRKRPETESTEQHENTVRFFHVNRSSSISRCFIPRQLVRERSNPPPNSNSNSNNNNSQPLKEVCSQLPRSRWPSIQQLR